VDAVRIPVVPPTGDCKPFQEVLIELGTRLKLPTFVTRDGQRKYRDYPDFVVNWETDPGSGIGFLAGWRGKGGEKFMVGEPNPKQWEMYAQHDCVFHYELPRSYQYMRNWNQGYLEWSRANRVTRYAEPILIHLYSEVLQRFRAAARGLGLTRKPPEHLKQRIETYFDPLPFYYEPLEAHVTDRHKYPLAAVTQRPMAMYHSWDSQNAWLRQIHTYNLLHINTQTARAAGIADGDWVWVESQWGRVRCKAAHSQAVEPGTVWTWNAIGKAPGAWALDPDANEAREGFLLNPVISEELPVRGSEARISNSDPVTGQAAWYDVRVRVVKAEAGEPEATAPRVEPMRAYPGMAARPRELVSLPGLIATLAGRTR
jgi:anaerobic selenocysteine-containing dehydrogenase